jgi:hypothetical protein
MILCFATNQEFPHSKSSAPEQIFVERSEQRSESGGVLAMPGGARRFSGRAAFAR